MSRRTVTIAVTAAALAFSGGLGLWTATAAPADEVPPAVVQPSISPSAPAVPPSSGSVITTPPDRAGGISCGLCAVPGLD